MFALVLVLHMYCSILGYVLLSIFSCVLLSFHTTVVHDSSKWSKCDTKFTAFNHFKWNFYTFCFSILHVILSMQLICYYVYFLLLPFYTVVLLEIKTISIKIVFSVFPRLSLLFWFFFFCLGNFWPCMRHAVLIQH